MKKCFFILTFLLCVSILSFAVEAKDIKNNDTKFQQYEQEIKEEPINYYNLYPHHYHPSFAPYYIYSPYTYQYLDERDKINEIREDNSLEDPQTYNIEKK